ncbi:bifunctional adenosylcobinamide kinase/adenosylcobinamide-phosphate guanylyltransferase [Actinoalloteichus hymeniacidonis]|uniref:Adenosylcobinamide kinase n=1 Tax=Actinoalloteichus hymeniacidonis TaxID=340345 RepID=A0AAC9HT45_9PSEU|nr:bifunctional adenosylcobinamide kinase/adenosylcobinamide-phosphate guanylyltransferase [Actinoalloteichus hymeniacidonis]AOS65152.1 adenosylcobinamide-phosphate guanylyltransferase [Actinoalloteichus hymeniacidonis]MBB5906769.1 adenosylcobinamide kinase/adenosylcobinamide-phosphate guanylyltransferase [Actinoalloteichus hymeniacidonis]
MLGSAQGSPTGRTLILGGARSGKSAQAEGLLATDRPAVYLATGRRDPADADFSARIAAHTARRPPEWRTVELSTGAELPARLRELAASTPATPVLVDDLATWLAGLFDDHDVWADSATVGPSAREQLDLLVSAVAAYGSPLVLVSAEVGLGVIPSTRSGRLFRDELGALNARLAEVCDEVFLVVAGLPLRLR